MTVIRAESGVKIVLRHPDHPELAAAKTALFGRYGSNFGDTTSQQAAAV
jgi:hypothetical protein